MATPLAVFAFHAWMSLGVLPRLTLGDHSAQAERFAPRAPAYGYTMQEQWDTLWRRFQDRTARGDDLGPLLQLRPDLERREYPLTLAVSDFPMRWERDWATRDRGARMWMHSDDEFFFLNRVQIKEYTRMGRVGQMGLRYDRIEGRTIKSSLLRLDFRFPDIAGSGAFVEIRANLRATKPDLDAQVAVGQQFDWGRVAANAVIFDPITNASDALVQARDGEEIRRLRQKNLPLGWTLEAQTKALHGVRAEAYIGSVVPNRLRVEFSPQSDDPDGDFLKEQSALLAGALVEYAPPMRSSAIKMHTGVSAMHVATEHQVRFDDASRAPIDAPERSTVVQAWWLAHLRRDLDLQVMGRYTHTRLGQAPGLAYRRVDLDQQWFAEARATWMFTRPFGMELGYSMLNRKLDATAGYQQALGGLDNRGLVRFVLRLRHSFWVSFGAGFDLDRGGEVYDQAGMTMILRW